MQNKGNDLRVLQIIDSLISGGAERMAVNISNTFTDFKIENKLVVTRSIGDLFKDVKDKKTINFLNKKSTLDIVAFIKLIIITYKFKPNVIHCHSSSIFWGIIIKKLFTHSCLIFHDHNGNRSNLNNKNLLKIIPHLNGIIVVNNQLYKWYINNTNLDQSKIKFLTNFPYLNVEKKSSIKNKIKIIHLSNFRRVKDHFTFLKAINLIKNKINYDIIIILAGNTKLDPEYTIEVKKMITDLKLNHLIEIKESINNVAEELSSCDIGIICSVSEGLPVALLEYGLSGLAVICTNVGHCPDVLCYGENGWIVEPQDPENMSKALIEAIENKNNITDTKKKNLNKYINSKYSPEIFYQNYKDFIFKNII